MSAEDYNFYKIIIDILIGLGSFLFVGGTTLVIKSKWKIIKKIKTKIIAKYKGKQLFDKTENSSINALQVVGDNYGIIEQKIYNQVKLEPIILSPEQEDLFGRLDDLHEKYSLKAKPSDMFKGALFAAREECRSNPDWIAQAANSLREILYPFWSKHVDGVADRKTDVFKKYGSVKIDETLIENVGRTYGLLNDLSHHGATSTIDFTKFGANDFNNILAEFEEIMKKALTCQIDIHKEIDEILEINPTEEGSK